MSRCALLDAVGRCLDGVRSGKKATALVRLLRRLLQHREFRIGGDGSEPSLVSPIQLHFLDLKLLKFRMVRCLLSPAGPQEALVGADHQGLPYSVLLFYPQPVLVLVLLPLLNAALKVDPWERGVLQDGEVVRFEDSIARRSLHRFKLAVTGKTVTCDPRYR